ncbi:MAG: protein kinase, partial [Deltaproteobacteria bacterium]|nr:protein kinase [Deltaproteobacteria bacterium]
MSRSPLDEEEASAPTLAPGSGAGSVPRVLGTERKPEIPGYVLHELVGRGGMGEVWRATQSSLGRTVAVKLLREELSRDASFAARFEQEAAALAALAHPNVVQAIDRGNA